MNTAAAIFGLIGSLLLVVQPAVVLWRRRAIRQIQTALAGDGDGGDPPAAGVRVSRPATAAAADPAAPPMQTPGPPPMQTPAASFARVAATIGQTLDRYAAWQAWSMIAGALCLAASYLLAALAANLG